MLLLLKGTHGTTKSRVESILLSRNIHPAIGTRGHGSYFWRFNSFAEELGVCWHKKNLSEKRYDTDEDKSCAVFTANIDVDENNYYNINAPGCNQK